MGHGQAALMYYRQEMRANGKLSRKNRVHDRHVARYKRFAKRLRRTRWRYSVADLHKKYNGVGHKGTGGPKGEWLRRATDAYIESEFPELRQTRVREMSS